MFLQSCPLKGTAFERKIKLTFYGLLIILSKYPSEFLACNGCFGLFTKIKKGLGLAFDVYFVHDFRL